MQRIKEIRAQIAQCKAECEGAECGHCKELEFLLRYIDTSRAAAFDEVATFIEREAGGFGEFQRTAVQTALREVANKVRALGKEVIK